MHITRSKEQTTASTDLIAVALVAQVRVSAVLERVPPRKPVFVRVKDLRLDPRIC